MIQNRKRNRLGREKDEAKRENRYLREITGNYGRKGRERERNYRNSGQRKVNGE